MTAQERERERERERDLTIASTSRGERDFYLLHLLHFFYWFVRRSC